MKYFSLAVLILGTSCMGQKEKPLGRDALIFKDTPVWEVALAIKDNDTARVRELLTSKPKSIIDFKEKYFGQTLLNWAVYSDKYIPAKILLEHGANPNIKASDSTTAVINAADKPTSDYLKLVLKHGGDVNTIANIDSPQRIRTPLIAASAHNLESVKLLIDLGANANYIRRSRRGNIGGENVESALIAACLTGKIDIVKYLLMDVKVAFDYTFITTIDGEPLNILSYLRRMTFELNSSEHKIKMDVVKFLGKKGLDYWKEPIPRQYFENYDKSFLEKY
jgi:ankyrin repeat protein